MDRPVNLLRATVTCNSFYIFFSAAKAALLPFLTLFFRLIGLSAFETGIIMATKALTGFIFAPLWARCAVTYNRRRVALIFSLFMMAVMYMSFTAVYYKIGNTQRCDNVNISGEDDNFTLASHVSDDTNETKTTHLKVTVEPIYVTTTRPVSNIPSVESASASITGDSKDLKTTFRGTIAQILTTPFASAEDNALPTAIKQQTSTVLSTQVSKNRAQNSATELKMTFDDLKKINAILKNQTGITFSDLLQSNQSAHQLYLLAHDKFSNFSVSEDEIQQLLDLQKSMEKNESVSSHEKPPLLRFARNLNFTLLNNLKDTVGELTTTLEEKKLLLFVVVLLIIIFGEFFSSPVEKIADDAWFDFLERIDDMERYGRQRYWGSLSFVLIPIIVTSLVDYTPCRLLLSLHHFLLHFYIFGIFLIFTIFMAFYFPMPPPVKQKYTSKVGKAMRIICCDARGFLFVVTLLVAGMVFASFNNFLFWRLQDLGASELTLGLTVSVGAFAETPMLFFSNKLVRKLGNGGLVSLSLFVLSLRLLYYGFLRTPWAVVPIEITNAFTHTALWYAVLSYEEFNIGSAMDRSIRSILSSLYFGLGFSLGAFASGFVYQEFGSAVLFWGASAFSGVWCIVFSVFQLCLPQKERVKYIKLLRKDEDESSDEDDDWLELALKEH